MLWIMRLNLVTKILVKFPKKHDPAYIVNVITIYILLFMSLLVYLAGHQTNLFILQIQEGVYFLVRSLKLQSIFSS